MNDSDGDSPFNGIRRIGFDPAKREKILGKRHIDLADMRLVLNGPYSVRRSDRNGEERFMVFGFLEDVGSSSSARYETIYVM